MGTPRADVTDAELAVLKLLWDDGPATIRDLADRLYPGGGASEYSTVQKLLERLQAKRCVRRRARERVNVFAASVGREDLIAHRLRETASKLCEGSLTPLLTQLVGASRLTPEDLDELRELIGQRRSRSTGREAVMAHLAQILLINAASATLLALVVLVISRFVRRPGVVHVLWLLVLVKLVMPPVVEVEALPRLVGGTEAVGASSLAAGAVPLDPAAIPEVGPAEPQAPVRALIAGVPSVALAVWIGVALLLVGLALRRARRFEQLIARSAPAPAHVLRMTRELAARLGLSGTPPVRWSDARVAPMLWGRPGGSAIVLPSRLLLRLSETERRALIAHELAHVRRRDHWVRYLETLVAALFWWHPLVWWVRRRLRVAEERSCDLVVLESLPGHARCYASSLVKTLEFLAGRGDPAPILATGAGEARQLKERITMIVRADVPRRPGIVSLVALGALAVTALALFPTLVADDSDKREPEKAYHPELADLERQQLELQLELRRLHERRLEIERDMRRDRREEELERSREEIDRLRAEGLLERAEHAERVAAELQRAREMEEHRMDLKVDAMHRRSELEIELQELRLSFDEARAAGDAERASELERRQSASELRDRARELERQRRYLHDAEIEERMYRLQEEIERLKREQSPGDESSEHLQRLHRELKKLQHLEEHANDESAADDED